MKQPLFTDAMLLECTRVLAAMTPDVKEAGLRNNVTINETQAAIIALMASIQALYVMLEEKNGPSLH